MGLGLIERDQVPEKVLFLLVEAESVHAFNEALLSQVPFPVHDELEEIDRLESGLLREASERKPASHFLRFGEPVL